jgi:transcriptional regulator with XRE-family HTH domain
LTQQPELGKKIADLRKAKGLTQEELVEKCNLNVRTLQRIESGEVMPRTYTIRLIFEALEVPFDKSINDKGLILKWLEQFYTILIDLFNLKTNAMKKVSILTVILSSIVMGILALTGDIQAQKENLLVNKIPSNNTSDQNPNSQTAFNNFSCQSCFDEEDVIIGHDVKFKLDGVYMSIGLIKLNKKTREFNCGYISGKLFQNKIELYMLRDIINKGLEEGELKLTANKVEQAEDKYFLEGKAILTVAHNHINDTIKTDEIILFSK